jgi:hypothetical protein
VLEQTADRVSHRIEVLDSASRVLAELRSIEGTSSDEWPPSPALQSCSVQKIRPGVTAAFLVGMAGKSHWSASVEAITGEGKLVFDLACRLSSIPQWIGSTYELLKEEAGESRELEGPARGIVLSSHALLSILPEPVGKPGNCRCQITENRIEVRGNMEGGLSNQVRTCRWRYRLKLQITPASSPNA